MISINTRSFPRAGLLGNPSDGYFGKTLSFAFADYCVDLKLTESAKMRFVPGEVDDAMFDSPEHLVRDLRLYGYYGGIRMLKAVAKLFFEYCDEHGIAIPKRNFTAEYRTNIPRLVGLSGSSAICSAMLKALCKFYEVPIIEKVGGQRTDTSDPGAQSVEEASRLLREEEAHHSSTSTSHFNATPGIPRDYTPTICLEAEKLELGINCGFQDRVIQMYGGLVFMDFNKAYVEAHNKGIYEELDPSIFSVPGAPLAPGAASASTSSLHLYIAFDPNRAEESGKAHKKVKRLFEEKKPDILAAMSEFADIAQRGRDLLVAASYQLKSEVEVEERSLHSSTSTTHFNSPPHSSTSTPHFNSPHHFNSNWQSQFASLVNANFDLRDRIFNVAELNRNMVMAARSAGASAKFAGSGGAIVGTYEDEAQFARLKSALAKIGCTTFKPTIGTRAMESTDLSETGTWRNS